MPKYDVTFIAYASKTIHVEAENETEAQKVALEQFDYPTANISNDFELDDWEIMEPPHGVRKIKD